MADGMFAGAEEIGGIVATFSGNTKPIDEAFSHVKKGIDSLKGPFEQLESWARKAFLGIAAVAGYAVKSIADAEAADEKLRAALEASSKLNSPKLDTTSLNASLDASMERLGAFAKAMQLLTTYDDEAIKGVAAFALNLGVANKDLEQVTRTGIGLAERYFGGDLKAGVEAAAKAYEGNTRSLAKVIPGLKEAGTAQAKWNEIQRIGAEGFKQAEARTTTLAGATKQLWNQINEGGEAIGAVLLPYVKDLTKVATNLTYAFANLRTEQVQQIVKWGLIAAGVTAVVGFGPKLIGIFAPAVKIVTAAVQGLGTAFAALIGSPLALTITAVAALAVGLAYAAGQGDTVASRITDGFKRIGAEIVHLLSSWHNFTEGFKDAWLAAGAVIQGAWVAIKATLGSGWDDLKGAVTEVATYWRGVFSSFASWLTGLFGTTTDEVGSAFSDMGKGIIDAFKFIGGYIGEVASFLGSVWGEYLSAVGGGFIEFGRVFAQVADTMFGSWHGFVSGLVTLWHQSGFIILEVWTKLQTTLMNLWEDLKAAFADVFYFWGGKIAEFANTAYAGMKSLVESIRNLWEDMIDAISSKMAGFLIRRQATLDVESTVKEGDTLDAKGINKLTGVVGGSNQTSAQSAELNKQLTNEYGGRQLTKDDIDALITKTQESRANVQSINEQKAAQLRATEHDARLKAIDAEHAAALGGIQSWSDKGLAATETQRAGNVAKNNKDRDSDLGNLAEARQKDLAADLAKMANLPKASDKVKGLLEVIEKTFNLSKFGELGKKIKDMITGVGTDADKAKADAEKGFGKGKFAGLGAEAGNADIGGKSVTDSFSKRLHELLVPAAKINLEEQKQKAEEAERKKAALAAKDNTKAVTDNAQAVKDLTAAVVGLATNGLKALGVAG